MDAHVFRIAGRELIELLDGARLEKIQGPVPGVILFTLFADGTKRRLVLRFGTQRPLLFFSRYSPANPPQPYSLVMRLRKHAAGRRLGAGILDYSLRSIAFPVLEGGAIVRHLLLDLKQGPTILPSLPEGFGREPAWPGNDVIDACCDKPWDKRQSSGPWQVYSVLSPQLRETLAELDVMEGRALMADLAAGGGSLFLYGRAESSAAAVSPDGVLSGSAGTPGPVLYSAWPLPERLALRRGLVLLGETRDAAVGFNSVLETVSAVDEPVFFHDLAAAATKPEDREESRDKKRLKRLLAKLEQEEKRLAGMLALRDDARLLQTQLWRFAPDERLPEVALSVDGGRVSGGEETADAEYAAGAAGGKQGQESALQLAGLRRIVLDPLLTVRENMQRMFHQSSRGARGLAMLEERRSMLTCEMESGMEASSAAPEHLGALRRLEKQGANNRRGEPVARQREGSLDNLPGAWSIPLPVAAGASPGDRGTKDKLRDIAVFRSSDGYTMLRGKSARGNHALLKLAQPYDLWLHARGGPSAHLVIRKVHAADDVPERTLREGAMLVGMKSWQRDDKKADIMIAYVKHVHPIKGASPGTVRVDSDLPGFSVSLPSGKTLE